MKKITLLAVAALAISFASCKKDYTCTCTATNGNTSGSTTIKYTKVKKSDAKKACDAATATYGGVAACTLN